MSDRSSTPRSERRHHYARLKKNRQFYHARTFLNGESEAQKAKIRGKVSRTPHPCSCFMCANPRHFGSGGTWQEKHADLRFQEGLDEALD